MKPRARRMSFTHSSWCISNSFSFPLFTRNETRSMTMPTSWRDCGHCRGERGEAHVGAHLEGVIDNANPADIQVEAHRPVGEPPKVLQKLRDLKPGEIVLQVDPSQARELDRQAGDDDEVLADLLIETDGENGRQDLLERDAAPLGQ